MPWTNIGRVNTYQSPSSVNLNLSEGTNYYVFLRGVYGNGGKSIIIQGANSWKVDVHPPDVNLIALNILSVSSWSNNLNQSPKLSWNPSLASDPGGVNVASGILKYQLALGSSVGASDIVNWKDISVSEIANNANAGTSVSSLTSANYIFTELFLIPLSTYYASLRVIDVAGNISTLVSGNTGWTNVDLGSYSYAGVTSLSGSGLTCTVVNFPAPGTLAESVRIYASENGGPYTLVGTAPNTATSYRLGGLNPASSYVFRAKALNFAGQEDTNTVTTASLTTSGYLYAGITSASAASTASITVNFPTPPACVETVNIYGSARGGAYQLLGSASNAASSKTLTGLNSGTTYTIKVKSLDTASQEDSNTATATAQTTPLTASKYQGPLLITAYGDSPNAPPGTPNARQVSITWLGFMDNSAETKYALVRTLAGAQLDSTSITACTSGLSTSCLVCTMTGAGAQTCTDTNVADSPAKYDYAVVLIPSTANGPEELLSDGTANSYKILNVAIPPNNMVLVHRDAANYEMCQLLSRASDPKNHQRCVYGGLGAAAYNVNPGAPPLNMPAGFYDMGYSFFVDRWTAACNWTPMAPAGSGMCGVGATDGSCFGNGTPAATIGAVGNVYYNYTGTCYYKKTAGAAWITLNTATLTAPERALSYTIDPGNRITGNAWKPPLVRIDQNRSWDTCQAIVDLNYGQKRLLRQREYRVMAAWSNLPGEPSAMTDEVIAGMENGLSYAHTPGNYSCNGATHSGVVAAPFAGATNYELSRDVIVGVNSFTIGSLGTSQCLSRYGVQDHVGNVYQWVSDQMTCSNVTHTCLGNQSGLDLGNGNSSGFDMNGFNFDGIQGPGGTLAGQIGPDYTDNWDFSDSSYGTFFFNPTLGLPLVGSDGGLAISIASFSSKLHGDHIWLRTDSSSQRGLCLGGASVDGARDGRWFSTWSFAPTSNGNLVGFRCALPVAE